ncbi:endonuclease/exonuclease/phosphatase family protein [Horticoccus luteus]|nr:endonuclease/exonuclease/phosphatase family protein [Horticoccus luteus]
MTFNIAHGRGLSPIQGLSSRRKVLANLRRIGALLRELKPDVVALQEIDERSRWSGNFDHLEFLREEAGIPHGVFGINTRRAGLFNLSYGNAILSRHPIKASENIVFGQRTVGEKGFLFAEIDYHGRMLPVINLHLHHGSRVQRHAQVEKLWEWLGVKHREHHPRWLSPPIVCGDFNNPRGGSGATEKLWAHLRAEFGDYALHPMTGRTFPSPLPGRTLDFIFLPPACCESSCEIVRAWLSDHRPVVVDFQVADARAAKAE